MIPLIVFSLVAILLWTFGAKRLGDLHVSAPVFMVAFGVVAGLVFGDEVRHQLNTHLAERAVELVLAVLLFVDAVEVRGGFLGGERGAVLRLLVLALPLSIAAAFAVGGPMLGVSSWGVVLAIACVVMPLDFAPAADLLRDRRLDRGLRHALAVESGYNDGLFSPVFAFALLTIGSPVEHSSSGPLFGAVHAALGAAAVGVGMGALTGLAHRLAVAARWTGAPAVRVAMALVPIITYALAIGVGGNGFVAAFLAGIAYKAGRMGERGEYRDLARRELSSVEDLSVISSTIMWFVFGAAAVLVFRLGLDWPRVLYGLLALTLVRMVPVYVSMLGSPVRWRDRTLLGVLGPRGTTSIVFGLLAYNATRQDDADVVLYVMTVVVLGSILLHGIAIPFGLHRFSARGEEPASG
ncbi:cation:proton antiporter [Actinomadura oligospora]|uniref:cation:proton antiporter domain-containing protein n=1 Tax=Actinomadura oligospora TaxID=111804 RepID=UPI00054EA945|nr:cation:proton antiporter [Actinomadura oligospora]